MKIRSFLVTIILTISITSILPSYAMAAVTPAIAAGNSHTVALKNDGTVWAWGLNSNGQLGNNSTTQRLTPVQVSGLSGVTAIAAGSNHTVVLKSDGTVMAWGLNSYGQLGDNTTTQRLIPVQVSGLNGVVAIAAGGNHSVALKSDGTVWAWGANGNGQLGDNTTTQRLTPVQASNLNGVVAIAVGGSHSVALKSDGTVWGCGYNGNGQLGNNGNTYNLVPVQVGLNGVISITAGNSHTAVLKSDGTVWACGYNNYGQLGDNTTTQRKTPIQVIGLSGVVAIAAGGSHTVALKSDGTVWDWGYNGYGQLGNDSITQNLVPVQVNSLNGMIAIAAGGGHTLALKNDDTMWAWGYNNYGQLGNNSVTQSLVPGLVAQSVTMQQMVKNILDSDFTPITTNSSGLPVNFESSDPGVATIINGTIHIVAPGTTTITATSQPGAANWPPAPPAKQTLFVTLMPTSPLLMTNAHVAPVGQNVSFTVFIKSVFDQPTGTVSFYDGTTLLGTATLDAMGQAAFTTASLTIGIHSISAAYAGTALLAQASSNTLLQVITTDDTEPLNRSIAAGYNHSMALKNDGTVWSWGLNSNGQLGDNTTTQRLTPGWVSSLNGVAAIAAGGSHSLALKSVGTVWAWGANGNGQLGDNTTTQRLTPVQVSDLSGVVAISAGSGHSMALKSDGTVWTWGFNNYGQLGNNSITQSLVPVRVNNLSNVIAISAGERHSMALKSDGTVWTWGDNGYGQLGDNSITMRLIPVQVRDLNGVISIASGGGHSMALKSDSTVWAWGVNGYGQLGDNSIIQRLVPVQVNSLNGVSALAAGSGHSLALKNDGTVWTWGYYGGLVPVQFSSIGGVVSVAGGNSFTLALKSDGTVWAWGVSGYGQLGNNSTTSSLAPVSIANIITFTSPSTKFILAPDYTPAVASTGLLVSYTSSNPAVASIVNNQVHIVGAGTTIITASQEGAGIIPAANSVQQTLTVVQVPTITTIASGTDSSVQGANVTFTVTVTSHYTVPTGTVSFYDGAALLGTVTLDDIGQAAFSTAFLAIGNHSISAIYSGTAELAQATSNTLLQEVFANTITFTSPSTKTLLDPDYSPAVASSGLLVSYASSNPAVATIVNNQVHIVGLGTTTISASQGGNGGIPAATSVQQALTVTKVPTTMTVTSGRNPSVYNTNVTFTATVTSQYTIPTGTVSFYDGGAGLLDTVTLDNMGHAVLTTKILAPDIHAIVVVYSGTAVLAQVTSNSHIQMVVASENTLLNCNIAAGYNHSMALLDNGTVWNWGDNYYGQLGNNSTTPSTAPLHINGLNDIAAIAAGDNHNLVMKNDGTVWTWGDNSFAQLGVVTGNTKSLAPVYVSRLSGVVAIAAGSSHSMALKIDGTVWDWGYNSYGQLGNNSIKEEAYPVQVSSLDKVVSIAAGGFHSVALKRDGTVWTWGNNGLVPAQVSSLSGMVAVAAGRDHTLALKSDGTVWAWGNNSVGQLGDKTTTQRPIPVQVSGLNNVIAISAGGSHSMALKNDGTVWTWGYNGYGQLGNNTTTMSLIPVQVVDLDGAVSITAGNSHSVALKSDGTVWSWGGNINGQLGNNSTAQSLVPVPIANIITFTATSTKSILDPDYSPAVASSGLLVSYTSSNPAVATILNNQVHLVGAGTTTITAIQDGNGTIPAATPVQQALTVTKVPTITTMVSGSNPAIQGANVTFIATVSSQYTVPTGTVSFYDGAALLGTAALDTMGQAAFTTSYQTIINHSISAMYSGTSVLAQSNSNTLIQEVTANFITFTSPSAKYFPSPDYSPAIASSGLLISYTSSNPAVATIVNNQVHIVGPGTTTITASQMGNSNIPAAIPVQQTLTVYRVISGVTLTAPATPMVYGQAVTLTAMVSAGSNVPTGFVNFYEGALLLGSASLDESAKAVFTTSALSAGTPSVTATYTGDINFASATIKKSLTIDKALLTVTANNLSRSVNSNNPVLTWRITGFLNNDSASVISGGPAIYTTAPEVDCPVGDYPIVVSIGNLTSNNYSFNFVNGTLTVLLPYTINVSIAGNGYGDVNSNPSGIACSSGDIGACSNQFDALSVNLIANPSVISLFSGWTGCLPANAKTCTVGIGEYQYVTATFILAPKAKVDDVGYASLNDAYQAVVNSANAGAIINLLGTDLNESLLVTGKDIILNGGFKTDDTQSGLPTYLKGTLKVKGGSLRVDGIKVSSP